MDPRLLKQYNRELAHLREMGGEFANEFPKIAGRLGLDAFECADPYVERLLEGFAFMAARVQVEIDAQFPRFTRHLLDMVFPHYLAPVPSMAVVNFAVDLTEPGLEDGFIIPQHTSLRGRIGKGDQTACVYRTAHPVTLWPLELIEADYLNRNYSPVNIPDKIPNVRAVMRLRFRTTAGVTASQLQMDRLPIYLRADGEQAMRTYEQLLANALAVVVRDPSSQSDDFMVIPAESIKRLGFDDDTALFPYRSQSFHGYRLLHEYFAMPERFMFVEFTQLKGSTARCEGNEFELLVLLDRVEPRLENVVQRVDFELFCSPAINLFPKRADRIHLRTVTEDFHVLPDRTRPMDFEVYDITSLTGYGTGADSEQEFFPFYALNDATLDGAQAYFSMRRVPRVLSSKQRRQGPRSSYVGSEVFVSLVDSHEAPYGHELRQLAPMTLCSNRDLALHMPLGQGDTDLSLDISAPVKSTRCVAGPTKPRPSLSYSEGESAWRLINHLSLNYLTLSDTDQRQGASAMRELLRLYSHDREPAIQKQIDGLRSVVCLAKTTRLPTPGPIVFGRALEISVTFDESAYEGTGVFLLGAVLEHFFAKYVSINSMTETVIRTNDRGEVMRWPVRTGKRHTF